MAKKQTKSIVPIVAWFQKEMPVVKTELVYENPFQLLVAVILSAQCTDKRVNMTTPALLERYPTAAAMAEATPEAIFPYIRSISYPNNKAKHLVGMAQMLHHQFHDEMPSDVDELQRLPGVGRKTANVIASVIFDKNVIAVDTHVFRVAHRLGLSKGKTPLAVEKDLESQFPEAVLGTAHHWLILHGRYVCTARRPHCADCGLAPYCPYPATVKYE